MLNLLRISYCDCFGETGAWQPSQSPSYCGHLYPHTWDSRPKSSILLSDDHPLILADSCITISMMHRIICEQYCIFVTNIFIYQLVGCQSATPQHLSLYSLPGVMIIWWEQFLHLVLSVHANPLCICWTDRTWENRHHLLQTPSTPLLSFFICLLYRSNE